MVHSGSLCGPQFPYLCSEELALLFVTLASRELQTAFWKAELVKALEQAAEMPSSTM